MNGTLLTALIVAGMVSMVLGSQSSGAESQLAHMVFFTLKDDSDNAKQKMIDACNKYLSGHDGTVYYSAGALVPDLDRDVNDREFHIALHVVFKNRAAHDTYQKHERHLQFIQENKENWKKVRVFDSYLSAN